MNDQRNKRIISYFLVLIQFGCLAGLLFTGPLLVHKPLQMVLQFLSVLLIIWAIVAMRKSKLSVFPDLKEGATFIVNGPYRMIRHPMYLAVIIFALSIVSEKMSYIRVLFLLFLIIDLLIKIEFEERILVKEFKDYSNYKKVTRKLIPYIY
jgi:protein-S-isoprenylcysteine O-methyltransferase Ste14